jgi:hypothetical protein
MKAPRISTLIITGQLILLLICLGYLTVILIRNYCLKMEAKQYATTAGFEQATRNFARGHAWLYEIKLFKFDADDSGVVPTDGDIKPADKREGRFEIYYYLVDQNFPYGHTEIQQAYINGYNDHMRQFFDHPEWFDKDGHRVSVNKLNQQTNNSNTSN